MNQIIIICLSFFMMSLTNPNNLIEYEQSKDKIISYNTEIGVPIHEVISRPDYFTIEDYKKEYELIKSGGLDYHDYAPLHGLIFIKPDNTLWNYVVNSYEKENRILFEKMGNDVISVEMYNDTILKLKTDESLWIKGYEDADKNIIDEYGFSKIEDDIIMILPANEFKELYVLKKDNTLWKIPYTDSPVKVLDDIAYIHIKNYYVEKYTVIIKTDGSLWQCEGINFEKLEKVTDNAIYTDACWNYALVVKKDKSLYLWNCDNPSKELIKIDDNVAYGKVSNQLSTLKTDGSLWYYYFNHKSINKNTVLKAKLLDNVKILLSSHTFIDKNNKLVRINDKNENTDPSQATLEIIEGYDIKTPELYDITKPFE